MAVFKMPGIMKEQEKKKNLIECHHLYPMCVIYCLYFQPESCDYQCGDPEQAVPWQ